MLHDASGRTWRQTCFVPAAAALEDTEVAVSVLGRFVSTGNFAFRQASRVPALHIVTQGTGEVHVNGKVFVARPGSVFGFAPDEEVWYHDRPGKPWTYTWINFVGRRAAELSARLGGSDHTWCRDDLAVAVAHGICDEIEAAYRSEEYSWCFPTLAAWRLLDGLSPRATGAERERHVAAAVRGILDAQFAAPLKLGTLARQLRVDRSTVFRQFHRLYGSTPKAYLDRVRLDHAAVLLRDGTRTVADTARACGYASAQRFAKAFAQRFGTPPSRFRA
jgi:AraC-like DNA-binding protein